MKIKKQIWLPTILAIYFIAMSVIFGADLIASRQYARFWISATAETAVIIGLYFALRRRDRLRRERENDDANRIL